MLQGRICDVEQVTGTKVVLGRAGTKVVLWAATVLCTEVSLAGGWDCVMCCVMYSDALYYYRAMARGQSCWRLGLCDAVLCVMYYYSAMPCNAQRPVLLEAGA